MTHIFRSGEHTLTPDRVSPEAKMVVLTLQQAGFQAFIVGGGVRDLLLNLKPKDFDIATNARPEEIRQIFKNSRLIGRRFRIAHIYFGRNILEVSTFRADHTEATHEDEAEIREDGIILRDNVFGTVEQDAKRRDFTVNSLYYDPIHNEIWDYCDSFRDIREKKIRMIGDPDFRLQEDPMRMLRAIRFANKLGFSIEPSTESAFPRKVHLLEFIPPGRRFDEYLKLFLHGQAKQNFTALLRYDALKYLFPGVTAALNHPKANLFLTHALENTDLRVREEKTVNPSFLIAAFLWEYLQQQKASFLLKNPSVHEVVALTQTISMVLSEQVQQTSMPKRLSQNVAEIWSMQYALERRRPRQILRILHNPKFRAAYDFLLMREIYEVLPQGLTEWWTTLQTCPPEKQKGMIKSLPAYSKK
jgi:poly(A) polymerase